MHRIDSAGNVGNMFSSVVNEGSGQFPTIVDAAWLNAIQEEIVSVLTAAGIAPVKGTNTQLSSAITARINTLLSAYDTALDVELATYQSGINDAMTLFQNSVNAALAAAATRPGLGYYLTGTVIPAGARLVKADGALIPRTGIYSGLWAYATASGNLAANQGVYDANPGMYGPGDGATTFQLPTVEDFVRSLKPGRAVGSKQEDAFQGFQMSFPYGAASSGGSTSISRRSDINVNLEMVLTPEELNPYGAPRMADETRPKNIAYPFVITY